MACHLTLRSLGLLRLRRCSFPDSRIRTTVDAGELYQGATRFFWAGKVAPADMVRYIPSITHHEGHFTAVGPVKFERALPYFHNYNYVGDIHKR
jgi:hypothetical protein